MTRAIKQSQIDDGAKHLDGLRHSQTVAEYRRAHFDNLQQTGYSDAEYVQLALDGASIALQYATAPLKSASIAGHSVPTIAGTAVGGMQPGSAVMAAAQAVESVAGALQHGAGMAAAIAQFQRRAQDWELQRALASYDVEQLQIEIDGAEIRQTMLERDLELHDKATEHARDRDDFFRKKFSNGDLYQWTTGQLSRVYFQTYELAFALAQRAQMAYCFERNIDLTDGDFLAYGKWDNLRKGLLAGEWLMLGLNQLEKAHLDTNAREFEIEKTISLLQLDPQQILSLRNHGKCTFELDEALFDHDFPGHYCRRIKAISLTIPAVVGPYQNVHAVLTQTTNRVVRKSDIAAVKTLLTGSDTDIQAMDPGSLRTNWRPNQHIAVCRGVDDTGLFQLDFRDERYLPFEGTGAISAWELSMPKGAKVAVQAVWTGPAKPLTITISDQDISLTNHGQISEGTMTQPPDLVGPWTVTARRADLAGVADLLLVVPWECQLDWTF